eukprot:TRINITY_DN15160_c0_g3_i2.p1 TRINITY_DN15160_c0_g3~~TRINITY_DN15160_c0_g3_i2.p1  ORF type:complete len:105 (-),score=4.08 TRINITY_DN15160_c0_g3_i2:206-520(-)
MYLEQRCKWVMNGCFGLRRKLEIEELVEREHVWLAKHFKKRTKNYALAHFNIEKYHVFCRGLEKYPFGVELGHGKSEVCRSYSCYLISFIHAESQMEIVEILIR